MKRSTPINETITLTLSGCLALVVPGCFPFGGDPEDPDDDPPVEEGRPQVQGRWLEYQMFGVREDHWDFTLDWQGNP